MKGRTPLLTAEQCEVIRALRADGVLTWQLAVRYGTSRRTIQRVVSGRYSPAKGGER